MPDLFVVSIYRSMTRAAAVGAVCLSMFVVGCGYPGFPDVLPTDPTPALVTLTGTVSALGGGRITGATVRIGDGVNVGHATTTNANGEYHFDALTVGDANVSASASGYEQTARGVLINSSNTLNFALRPLSYLN